MMDLKNKKALVVGLKRSGVAAARFMAGRGAVVTVTDKAEAEKLVAEREALKGVNVRFVFGEHRVENFTNADLIVVSPGVPLSIPPIEAARKARVHIIGELELAARFLSLPIIAITGTNGKSTVTELTGAILRESGKKVFVGGNIGNPLINLIGKEKETDVAVVEISSFQLEAIEAFHPHIGALLNITPDHLDRYPDMDSYVKAKARIWMNMGPDDWAVVNASDELSVATMAGAKCRRLNFSIKPKGTKKPRAYVKASKLVIELDDRIEKIPVGKMKIAGAHNIENALASVSASLLAGASPQGAIKAIETFPGLPHRTQFIREVGGVKYFDDSKGTNVGAVIKSLEGFDTPVVLIAGGLDKEGDFRALRPIVSEKVKALVLIGSAAKKIEEALGDVTPVEHARDMQEAVRKSQALAKPGEVVLLSPGCASFDMFRDYGHRGEVFQEAVRGLKG